jgi:hypothetical protein
VPAPVDFHASVFRFSAKSSFFLVRVEDVAVEIGNEQVAERRLLEVASDLALRRLVVRIVETARSLPA